MSSTPRARRGRSSSTTVAKSPAASSSWEDRWLSPNESKRTGQKFFLLWQPIWLLFFGGIVVTGVYKQWTDIGYAVCGLLLFAPLFFVAIFVPLSPSEAKLPFHRRYIFKANIYIFIINFVGSYFWTHYFFNCLGAAYTFPVTWKLNGIPLALYGITQSYFSLYYIGADLLIRRTRNIGRSYFGKDSALVHVAIGVVVCALSWIWSFLETKTIESVPYYYFVSVEAMYKVGLTFYALYFVPTFPMFFLLDEEFGENWTLWTSAVDSFGGSMIVFILCDFWRLIMADYMNTIAGVNASKVPFLP